MRLIALTTLLLLAAACGGSDPAAPTPSPAATQAAPPSATMRPTQAPPPTLTATPLPTRSTTPTSTPTPAATATATPVPPRPIVAFVSDWAGDDDVYLLDPASGALVQLTAGPGEDRDPAFSPDGRSLLYRSNAGGPWAFYRFDLVTGERALAPELGMPDVAYQGGLTCDPADPARCAFESYRSGNLDLYLRAGGGAPEPLAEHAAGDYDPAWRPGTSQLAFVSWRRGDDDLFLVDVASGELTQLMRDATDEEAPAWHPDGERLAFVRWIEGDADLYELHLGSGEVTRLTSDPYPDRDPAYGPDGTLYWTRYVPGEPFELHDPFRVGAWQLWARSPDGAEGPVTLPVEGMDVHDPVAAYAPWPELPLLEAAAAEEPPPVPPGSVELVTLGDVDYIGHAPQISARVAEAYGAWREAILQRTGYDFLGQISDLFRPLDYSGRDYGHLSWHRTGRTVDTLFEWHEPADGPNQLIVVRDVLGAQTYWRLYLKTRAQDGSMGEPLTEAEWVFWFNLSRALEPEARAAGGRPGAFPPGYYVDITQLAHRYGWHRIASYEEEDFDWRTDSVGREFWHFQHTDGLTWWEAMLELYPEETLEEWYGWSVCVEELGMDPAWLAPKGIPTPAPP